MEEALSASPSSWRVVVLIFILVSVSPGRVWWYLCVLWSLWRGETHTRVIQRFYEWFNIGNVLSQHQHRQWKLITFQRRAPKWILKHFLSKLAIDHHCTSGTQGMKVESWAGTRPGKRGWNLKQANCLPNIGQYNCFLCISRPSASPCHQFPGDLHQIAETSNNTKRTEEWLSFNQKSDTQSEEKMPNWLAT